MFEAISIPGETNIDNTWGNGELPDVAAKLQGKVGEGGKSDWKV